LGLSGTIVEIFIKLAPRYYDQLRKRISSDSPVFECIECATRIDHSVDGVLFEGYSIACDENQARIILEIAQQCCPDATTSIEQAIRLARQP